MDVFIPQPGVVAMRHRTELNRGERMDRLSDARLWIGLRGESDILFWRFTPWWWQGDEAVSSHP